MCVSLKGVYSNDDCGKLKSKDSNHTRRSKQNTYHVVNKNIAPSKVTDRRNERGDAFRGIPKLRLLVVLGVPWESPSLGSFHSLFHNPSNLYPKLENFTTQNSTKNLMSSVSARKQTTTLRYYNELIIYLYVLNLLYSNFSMVHTPRY